MNSAARRAPGAPAPWLAVALLFASGLPAGAQGGGTPVGQWLVQDGDGVIGIRSCGASLCGWIVGMLRDDPAAPMPRDVQGRSQCGLQILRMQAEDGSWRGTITNPRDGAVWKATMWLGEDGRLRLRGYLGIPLLGQTQVWEPFSGRILADCRMELPEARGSAPGTPPGG